ncbi:MAG: hypothetical protein ACX93N_12285 [Pseudohaliea sp.]
MNPVMLFVFAPLLALPLLPIVPGVGRRWLPPLAALLPAAALFPGEALKLPWVMLGAGLVRGTPPVAVIALLALFFARVLWPAGPARPGPRARACLLLGQGALGAALLASDLLLLLAGVTLATYALLAARLSDAGAPPGRLSAVVVVLVLGDLAAFEVALLFAKVVDHALVPSVADAAGALASSPIVAAFAATAAGSRGALLLLAGRCNGVGLSLAALALLVVPALGWRLGGGSAALGAVTAVAAFNLLAAALALLLARGLPRPIPLPGRRGTDTAGGQAGVGSAGLPGRLGALELVLGSWGMALAATVALVLLLLAATLR